MAFPTRPALTVELLEDRTNPSGNVTVWVGGGVLNVIGDDAANSIIIEKTGGQSCAVRPFDSDTTINGHVGGEFQEDIRNGYDIKMNGGDDTLQLVGIQGKRKFAVDMGDGNDTLVVQGVRTRRETYISLGAGNDNLTLNSDHFGRYAGVDGGSGTNSIAWVGADFKANSSVTGFQSSFNTLPPPVSASPPVISPPAASAPVVTLSTTGNNPTATATIPITATFDQVVSGFTASDLGITNGTVSNPTSTDGKTYTFDVTPTADGAIAIALPANSATNAAGTGNAAAATFTVRSIRTDAGMTNTAPSATDSNFQLQSSGISIWDVQEGSGTAAASSSKVQVFYSGWLTNGTIFDQSRVAGSPAEFALANTIQGFQLGIAGMKPGGIRRLVIPPNLGYGSTATGSIPANSTLIFEVKLVTVVS